MLYVARGTLLLLLLYCATLTVKADDAGADDLASVSVCQGVLVPALAEIVLSRVDHNGATDHRLRPNAPTQCPAGQPPTWRVCARGGRAAGGEATDA